MVAQTGCRHRNVLHPWMKCNNHAPLEVRARRGGRGKMRFCDRPAEVERALPSPLHRAGRNLKCSSRSNFALRSSPSDEAKGPTVRRPTVRLDSAETRSILCGPGRD